MKTERELIEDAKEAIAKIKAGCREVQEAMRGVIAHNQGDEEKAKANAAYITLGEFESLGGEAKQAHGRASDRLMKHWPNFDKMVSFGPGGGR